MQTKTLIQARRVTRNQTLQKRRRKREVYCCHCFPKKELRQVKNLPGNKRSPTSNHSIHLLDLLRKGANEHFIYLLFAELGKNLPIHL